MVALELPGTDELIVVLCASCLAIVILVIIVTMSLYCYADMTKPKQYPVVSRPPPGLPNPYTSAHRHSFAVASQSGRW